MLRICLPLLFAIGCATGRPDQADQVDDVSVVLNDFHDAAAKADEERYFAHFAPEGVFLGTDATERWDVPAFRAFAHPYFSKGKGWTYRPRDRHVMVRGDFAWFDELLEQQRARRDAGIGRAATHRRAMEAAAIQPDDSGPERKGRRGRRAYSGSSIVT